MEFYSRILPQLPLFALVFMRCTGLFSQAPLFGQQRIPAQVRIMLSLMIAATLFPLIPPRPVPEDAIMFIITCLLELITGLIYGWCSQLLFEGVVLAGQFIGLQMGFSQANIFNPDAAVQRPLISEFYYIMSLLVFFSFDGHHFLILAIQKSFSTVPVGTFIFNEQTLTHVTALFAQVFLVSLIIAAPINGVLTLIDLILGLVARTAPQMNILVISFSIKIYVGILTFLFSLAFTFEFIHDLLQQLLLQLAKVI